MLPGVGLTEMILLVVLGLVVVGPKDLPLMMRKFGKFTGKVRSLAFEFRQSFDELGRQAELEELRKEVADLKKSTGLAELDKDMTEETRKMQREMSDALSDTHKEMGKGEAGADKSAEISSEKTNATTGVAAGGLDLDALADETSGAEAPPVADADLGETGAENRIGGADAEAAKIAAEAEDAKAKSKAKQDTPA